MGIVECGFGQATSHQGCNNHVIGRRTCPCAAGLQQGWGARRVLRQLLLLLRRAPIGQVGRQNQGYDAAITTRPHRGPRRALSCRPAKACMGNTMPSLGLVGGVTPILPSRAPLSPFIAATTFDIALFQSLLPRIRCV